MTAETQALGEAFYERTTLKPHAFFELLSRCEAMNLDPVMVLHWAETEYPKETT